MKMQIATCLVGTLLTVSPAIAPSAHAEDLVLIDHGPAPEFSGISAWINSPPLNLRALRGKLVLVDFWTYSCVNCLRTLPYLAKWHRSYKDRGLVVVGVHTPEFAFERKTGNLQAAIQRLGIPFPVAQDNEYATWKAYENQYWPASYLVDCNGHVVLKHFGEGAYDEMEAAIRKLLPE